MVCASTEVFALDPRLGQGDDAVCVAIIDGPVDRAHPCFDGAKLAHIPVLLNAGPDAHASPHGTHVASIIFGQPGSPVLGVAPACRGLIIPIFASEASRDGLACSQLDLARAILLAVENGAHIVNISGGQFAPSGEPEPMLAQAIATCVRHDVLIVAAAGNDACECLHVPAAAASVLAVGAMDRDGKPLASSNWGAAYLTHGILAPGADVLGAAPGGGVARRSGTSFATPLVSGVAALLASMQLAAGPKPRANAIRAALLNSALPCLPGAEDCRRLLAGRLNVAGAIELVRGGEGLMSGNETPSLSDALDFAEITSGIATMAGRRPINVVGSAAVEAVRLSEVVDTGATALSDPPADLAREPKVAASAALEQRQVTLSDCGCGCGGDPGKCSCGGHPEPEKPPLVYALGKLGYDFGSEARRDSFIQAMEAEANNPMIPDQLLAHLQRQPWDAGSVIWTLNLDVTPIYAIQPLGPYAAHGYERLREFLQGQLHAGVELVSIPGVIGGSVRLLSGQTVPVVVPALRGMFSWATRPLAESVLGARPRGAEAQATYDTSFAGLTDFLARVYYDLRNLGITAEERAINYSATNALQVTDVIRSTTQQQLDLDTIRVKKSPVCRPDSDCYDVELMFFNPANTNIANRVFRFTVDVSDVIPVTVGAVRSWTRRI